MNEQKLKRISNTYVTSCAALWMAASFDMDEHGGVQIDHLIDNVKAEGKMALVRDFFEMIAQTDDKGR